MEKQPIVYTIVVTYNRLNFLKQCLKSIKNQTYPVKKIIVVDNCSTDETREYLKKLAKRDKTFQIIFNKDNLGMANAINLALMTIQAEDYDYLWITDDDNLADKSCLEKLLDSSEKNTILSPVLLDRNRVDLNFPVIDLNNGNTYYKYPQLKENKVFYCIPFNFTLIPKQEITFLSEDYFIRGEEIDFITQKIIEGKKLALIKSALVYCLSKRKIQKIKIFKFVINREMIDDKKIYYVTRNTLFLLKKYRRKIKSLNDKSLVNRVLNFYPYYRYNLLFFIFFYFFYNLFLFLFVYKSNFIRNKKSLFHAYMSYFLNKKGKLF